MPLQQLGPRTARNPFSWLVNWLEPLVPIVLAIHGSVLLWVIHGTTTQWLLVGLTFAIGLVGQLRRQAGAREARARRIAVFACTWLMMVAHTGVSSFFFLWLVVLVATYPLLVPLPEGRFLPICTALGYWALIPFSTTFPPTIVLINKFFHLNIVGYLVYCFAGFQARSMVKLWNTQRALREQEQNYRLLAEHTSDLVGLHQPDGTFIYVSPSVNRMLGYSPADIVGKRFEDLLASSQDASPLALAQTDSAAPYRVRHVNGQSVWLETKLTEIVDSSEQVSLIQSTSRDVSKRVAVELQLRHHALHDALTQLPNRRCFMERFRQEFAEPRLLSDREFALLQIDLDSFKSVNDSWGHASGDRLLKAVAMRISNCIRDTDLVARLGGDEFTVLMSPVDGIACAEAVARRIVAALEQPVDLGLDRPITIGASIGIVLSSVPYDEPDDLMRYADIAMYQAKQTGKARVTIYRPEETTSPRVSNKPTPTSR